MFKRLNYAAPATTGGIMARIRKTIVAVLGLAATLVSAGVLDDQAETIVSGLLALATAAGVYGVKNEPTA